MIFLLELKLITWIVFEVVLVTDSMIIYIPEFSWIVYFRSVTQEPSFNLAVSLYYDLQISHSKFFQIYEFTTGVSFICFFPSSHSLKQFKWIYFIEPIQLQGLIKGWSGSSSERQIRHIYCSLFNFSVFYLSNNDYFNFISSSYYFWFASSNSNGLLSNPTPSLF